MTGLDTPTRNALRRALGLIGTVPTGFDIDAVYGSLINDGIHVVSAGDIERAMFDDRCDFECHICHPEEET